MLSADILTSVTLITAVCSACGSQVQCSAFA
jgi:hypothetical protein